MEDELRDNAGTHGILRNAAGSREGTSTTDAWVRERPLKIEIWSDFFTVHQVKRQETDAAWDCLNPANMRRPPI